MPGYSDSAVRRGGGDRIFSEVFVIFASGDVGARRDMGLLDPTPSVGDVRGSGAGGVTRSVLVLSERNYGKRLKSYSPALVGKGGIVDLGPAGESSHASESVKQ